MTISGHFGSLVCQYISDKKVKATSDVAIAISLDKKELKNVKNIVQLKLLFGNNAKQNGVNASRYI